MARPRSARSRRPSSTSGRSAPKLGSASARVRVGPRAPGPGSRSLRGIRDLVELDAARLGLAFVERAGERDDASPAPAGKAPLYARAPLGLRPRHTCKSCSPRKRLDPGRHGMTEKNRDAALLRTRGSSIVPFAAGRLWRRHRLNADLKMAEAVELQIAFAIELLTMAVRCRNLASIRLDRNIIDNGAGRQRASLLFARTSRTRPSSNSSCGLHDRSAGRT